MTTAWMWAVFGAIVVVSLAIDLIAHRGEHAPSRRAAIAWSVAWIALAAGFAVFVGFTLGGDQAEDFVTAYILEKTLSMDNVFAFLLVFGTLHMSAAEQRRVLFWGILGALVFRGVFVLAGAAALSRWHEVTYVLGALLVYMGVRSARPHDEAKEQTRVLRFFRDRLHLKSTFTIAVLTIELTDVLFAIDSVPAVFAVSSDPFIVYSSNVFAILGLRALYLVIADLLGRLRFLQYGLAAILVLAGAKLLVAAFVHVPHAISLGAVGGILAITIGASLVWKRSPSQLELHARNK
jgi:tellurite resistance protein TerC